MARNRSFRCVDSLIAALTILLCFGSCCLAGPAVQDLLDKATKVTKDEGDLYNNSDMVTILNVTTFNRTVLDQNEAWLVEFYNRFCGKCQRFAPIWKEFAADVAGWRSMVHIGVVECVLEANIPLCREYNVTHFPSVRFLPAKLVKGNIGKEFTAHGSAQLIRRTLAESLQQEQFEGRGKHWPNLSPYISPDLQNLWQDIPSTVLFTLLIFKDSTGDVGLDLVLDMSSVPEIQARIVSHENEALAKLMQVSSFPSIVVVRHGHERGNVLEVQDKSLTSLKSAIKSFLKKEDIEIEIKKNIGVHVMDFAPLSVTDQQRHVRLLQKNKDVAFLADLENSLQFSLYREVSLKSNMDGPVLKSLYNYLQVIFKHFPLSPKGHNLIKSLSDRIHGQNQLSGNDWSMFLSNADAALDGPAWNNRGNFLGCQGSLPNLRGYPCSLWTLFHVLTVNALDSNPEGSADVLQAILGYVTHFFGCTECSEHFQSMAAKRNISNVPSNQDAVLWLWKAHNEVNARLAGDATEDPEFPKIQFPAIDRCPVCRTGDAWVESQVVHYLRSVYSHDSLNQYGSADSSSMSSQERGSPLSLFLAMVVFALCT